MAHGKICYLEIPAGRAEDSARFYSEIFGWTVRERGDGNLAFDDPGGVSGTWVKESDRTPDERTRTYIMVDSITESLKQIEDAGGAVITPRTDIGKGMGAFAVFTDPVGNEFGLYEEPRGALLPHIEAVHPVLMSGDVAASVRFYQRLGFALMFQDSVVDPRYAAVTRDGVELHLQWHAVERPEGQVDRPTCRFVVRDVDALYAELQGRDALDGQVIHNSPWLTPGDTPWGTREFHMRDPDGNGLQFYRPL